MMKTGDPRIMLSNLSTHFTTPEVDSVYLFELGFWLSCVLFLSVETIRKDFAEMCIHHAATCTLIGVSYAYDYTRIGLVVLILHDCGDIFLYFAKFYNYLKFQKTTDLLFGTFVIVFAICRLFLFPLGPIRTAWGPLTGYIPEYKETYHQFKGAYILPGMLTVLQALHVMWFALIIRMVIRMLKTKTVTEEGDIRSDEEESVTEEDNIKPIDSKIKKL
jgi:hypothetical protein